MRNKDKILKHFYERKKEFLYQQIYENLQCQVASHSLQHPIDKAGSATSLRCKDGFPKVNLPAEKLKLFINVSDSKENENNVDVTG